jgi:hypothetical protein
LPGFGMLDIILWPPIFVPFAVSVVVCIGVGALLRVWIGLLIAEIFSILGLAFLYVVGGALLNDELTVRSFLAKGYFSLLHASVFAFFGALVFAGHFARKILWRAAVARRAPEVR